MMQTNRPALYERMLLIRRFEELILKLFSRGELNGTAHACIGQEGVCVAAACVLNEGDPVVSNHRCHGHYLALTCNAEGLLAEMMGKAGGICSGWGGSQHLCDGRFLTNGILGSTAPVAAGIALAEKQKGTGAMAALFLGDGAFGQGIVYETLNLASLWSLPLLIIVENNRYAQSTPLEQHLAGSFRGRAAAFGISCAEIETNDVELLIPAMRSAAGTVRAQGRPFMLVVHTYRLCSHSKGDDYRSAEELREQWKKDPLAILGNRMDPAQREEAEKRVSAVLAAAMQAARSMAPAGLAAGVRL